MKSPHRGVGQANGPDRDPLSYSNTTLFGLVAIIWFASLAKGAHDLWAVSVLCGWLSLITAIYLEGVYKNQDHFFLPLAGHFSTLFLVFLLSARFSFDVNTTRLEMWIWLCSGVTFFLFVNVFHMPSLRFQFLKFSSLVIIPITLVAAKQYVEEYPVNSSQINILGLRFFYTHWSAQSTLVNSAVMAGFILGWAIILWHFRQKSPLYSCLFGTCLIALFLARSWWAGISLLLGFMYYYKERLISIYISKKTTMIAIAFLILICLISAFYFKFRFLQDPLYGSLDRFGWWLAGIRMAKEHPLAGVGLGGYATAFAFFKPLMTVNTQYAHSFPIQLLSETGFPGLMMVVILVMAYIYLLSKQTAITQELVAYRATVLALAIYSLTSIFTDYFIGKLILMMAMALTLCEANIKGFTLSKGTCRLAMAALLMIAPGWYLPFKASQCQVEGLQYLDVGNLERAELTFKKAVFLNPYQDESYASLARIDQRRYAQTHSVLDLASALLWTREALNLRKVPIIRRETAE